MSMQSVAKGFCWFLTGVTMGAAGALVLAPRKGSVTRRMIRKKSKEGRKYLAKTSKQLTADGEKIYEKGKEWVDDAAQTVAKRVKTIAA